MSARSSEELVRLKDGYDRFVTRFGDGPEVLLCLHGGPGANLRGFLPLREIADDQLQVVLYDQLGGGRSSRPDREELWMVETFVDEFAELVEKLNLGPVHLLGASWGGMLALECALNCPEAVKSLILCDTLASTRAAVEGFGEILAAASDATRAAVAANHQFDWHGEDRSEAGEALLDLYATHLYRSHPFDLERSRQEFIERIVPMLEDTGPAYEAMWGPNEFAPSGVLRDWDVSDRLGEIAVPTLVACGAYDHITVSCHRQIVEGLTDVRWLILGQSSHCTFQEVEVDVLMAAIRDFALRAAEATSAAG